MEFNQYEIEQALFRINGYFDPSPHQSMKIRNGDAAALDGEIAKAKGEALRHMERQLQCLRSMTTAQYLGKYPRTNRDLYDESVPMEVSLADAGE